MSCRYLLALFAMVATPATANETVRARQALSGPQAIRSYDFLNGTYDSPLADKPVKLNAGTAATGVSTVSAQVVFGDLDGDDNEEAVVVWQDEGAVGGSSGGTVYRLLKGELTSVWTIPQASRIDGWLQKALIDEGDLVLARDPEQSATAATVRRHFSEFLPAAAPGHRNFPPDHRTTTRRCPTASPCDPAHSGHCQPR